MKHTLLYSIPLLAALSLTAYGQDQAKVPEKNFPIVTQFSAVPSGKGWHGEDGPLSQKVKEETIQNIIQHGFTHLSTGSFSKDNPQAASILDYAQDLGMQIDFTTSGVELFGRQTPPQMSVFTQEYEDAMKERAEKVLGEVRQMRCPYSVFPYMDEPFHMDTTAFDLREPAREAFEKEYGYPMPASFSEARKDPRKYLDFINFQSSSFSYAWKKIYTQAKSIDPRPKVVITHDSHNTMGAGSHSNSVWAVDDVFHWGSDFADLFIYDIYPYTCEDYRVGESGQVFKPRMSQLHWTLAQMRNLTVSGGKSMGFWVGSYNKSWFSRFMGEPRRSQYWMEREIAYSAIGAGADYIITGINIPEEASHWDDLGDAMTTIQKEGGALLDSKRPQAKAAFLFPRTQHVLLNQECFNVALTFELCMRAFGEMDVIHEEQLTDSDLLGYEILVLGDVDVLQESAAQCIKEFVRKGGIVIADCVPQTDEGLCPSETLKEVFGVSSAKTDRVAQEGLWLPFTQLEPTWLFVQGDWKAPEKTFDQSADFKIVSPRNCVASSAKVRSRMDSGAPLLLENKFGKGKVYLFGFCLQDTYLQTWLDDDEAGRDCLQALVRKVFKKTRIKSSTYSTNPDVEVALRKGRNEAFALVINHEAEDAHTEATVAGLGFKVGKIVDVRTGESVKFRRRRGTVRFTSCPAEGSDGGVTRLYKICPKL